MDTTTPLTLKESLVEQVELRVSILERWIKEKKIPWRTEPDGTPVRDSNGELVPDFVPTNLLQFCAWTAEKNSTASGPDIAKLRRISRMSLYQPYHNDLRTIVDTKLEAAKACLAHQLEKSNNASIIEELQATVKLLNGIVDAQQRESRLARLRLGEVTTKYRMRHDEQRRVIAQLKTDWSAEQQKVASLTALLAKLSPLRAAPSSRPKR